MALLTSKWPNLLDLAKAKDPDGTIAKVVEILNETNEILDDMIWVEGNMETGNKTTVRTGIPAPTWRKLYQGVQPTKSRRAQVIDSVGNLEAYAEVDVDLVKMAKNPQEFRLQEDRAHIEGMSQEMADTLFFGNEDTEAEAFTGLAPRFNDLTTAENRDNIIDAGGTGTDNASIWLISWGPNTCHGIIPMNSQAGVSMQDLGEVTIEDVDGNGGRMQAFRSHYKWQAGLTVKDWRYVVRICNIDKSALTKDASGSSADLPDLMFQALDKLPTSTLGTPVFYMSRDIRTMYRRQASNKVSSSTLNFADIGGRRTMVFQENEPLRRCDALSADEARVT